MPPSTSGGRGSLRVRAKLENREASPAASGGWSITELPPGVSTATVMSEIEACSNPVAKDKAGKKVFTPEQLNLKAAFLSAISERGVRDESGKEHAVRLVIEPASFASGSGRSGSPAARSYQPRNQRLDQSDRPWRHRHATAGFALQHDRRMVPLPSGHRGTRRTRHRLTVAEKRIHILEGRLAVLLDIDKVIKVIRESDDPKVDLMAHFNLSAIQAEDILEIRLRQLARLEGIKIGEELAKLREEAKGLNHLLRFRRCIARPASPAEIEADAKKFGDDRRTFIEASMKKSRCRMPKRFPSSTNRPR